MSKTITHDQANAIDADRAEALEVIQSVQHADLEGDPTAVFSFFDALAGLIETSMIPTGIPDAEKLVPPVIDNSVLERQIKDSLTLLLQHESSDDRFARKTDMTAQERVDQLRLAASTFTFGLTLVNYAIHETTVMTHRRPRTDVHRSQWEDVTARIFAGISYDLIATLRTIMMIGAQAKAEAATATSKKDAGIAKRSAAAAAKRATAAEALVKKLQDELAKALNAPESDETEEPKEPKRRRTRAAQNDEQPVEQPPAEEAETPKTEPVASVEVNEAGPSQTSGSGRGRGRGNGRSLRQAARK